MLSAAMVPVAHARPGAGAPGAPDSHTVSNPRPLSLSVEGPAGDWFFLVSVNSAPFQSLQLVLEP